MPKPLQLWPYLAAPLGGASLALCYPPFNHSGFIWAFLIPFLAALWLPARKPKHPLLRGALLGYLFGLAFFTINLLWIREVHWAAITIALYLALYPAIFGAVAATIGRPRDNKLCPQGDRASKWPDTFSIAGYVIRIAALNAATWTALELLRGWLFSGFGWNGLGVAFHGNLLILAQIADIVGVTGLSFLVVFVGTIFAATLRRLHLEIRSGSMRPHLDFAVAVLAIILCFLYGVTKISAVPENPIEVNTLLVQANTPQEEKWSPDFADAIYATYERLTIAATTSATDLIIWPETALPDEYYENPLHQSYLNAILAEGDFELVLGTNENAIGEGYFNSMLTMRGNVDSMQSYRKVHLVPFGEYSPFRGKIKALRFLDELISGDFDRGTSTDPLPLTKPESFSVIPTICFEDTIGRLTRKFVRAEPQIIINCTNDGWFGETACAAQHMANAKFRCIELRRPMARAANTGVTCIIDETGSTDDRRLPGFDPRIISDNGNTFVQGFGTWKVALDRNPPITFYAKHGDLFSILCAIAATLTIAISLARKKQKSAASKSAP